MSFFRGVILTEFLNFNKTLTFFLTFSGVFGGSKSCKKFQQNVLARESQIKETKVKKKVNLIDKEKILTAKLPVINKN